MSTNVALELGADSGLRRSLRTALSHMLISPCVLAAFTLIGGNAHASLAKLPDVQIDMMMRGKQLEYVFAHLTRAAQRHEMSCRAPLEGQLLCDFNAGYWTAIEARDDGDNRVRVVLDYTAAETPQQQENYKRLLTAAIEDFAKDVRGSNKIADIIWCNAYPPQPSNLKDYMCEGRSLLKPVRQHDN
jgi:hypothetical protein